MPELPSVEEGGVKGFDGGSWNGVVMPAGTPQDIVNKIHAPLVAELQIRGGQGDFAQERRARKRRHACPIRCNSFETKRPSGRRSRSSRNIQLDYGLWAEPPGERPVSVKDDRQIQEQIELIQEIVHVLG